MIISSLFGEIINMFDAQQMLFAQQLIGLLIIARIVDLKF
jgi:hypothetical protein